MALFLLSGRVTPKPGLHRPSLMTIFFFLFFHHFIPEAEKYCLEKEVLLNTLAAEWCSVSPLFLDDFHPNVKVVEFSSTAQLSLTLCHPMDCSMPDPPVHHQLPELTQSHAHWVGDVILPSHPLFPLLLLPSIFPRIRIVSNESVLSIRWPNIGVSASASVLPMNIQNWFPLGLTGWISLQSKGLSRVFSNTTVQKHQFFGIQLPL